MKQKLEATDITLEKDTAYTLEGQKNKEVLRKTAERKTKKKVKTIQK